jgi:hypothetical protein
MLDYGSLQVRETSRKLLRNLAQVRVASQHKSLKLRMSELTSEIEILLALVEELQLRVPERHPLGFMNAGFVSVPYLYALLDRSSSTEEFIALLNVGRNVSGSSRCPYNEFAYLSRLDRLPLEDPDDPQPHRG